MIFNPAQFSKIAADNISELKKDDVYRLLDECGSANREVMAQYIRDNRKEYILEVECCLDELAE